MSFILIYWIIKSFDLDLSKLRYLYIVAIYFMDSSAFNIENELTDLIQQLKSTQRKCSDENH